MKLKDWLGSTASLMREMTATADRMRRLIVAMPAHDLLGYIYCRRMIEAMAKGTADQESHEVHGRSDLINENQFLLEYVHAVLASDSEPDELSFDEGRCQELFELGIKLKEQALHFAMVSSANTKDGIFGPNTADIEFQAKSNWVMLRGNRYQVLEEEFFRYVLSPHSDVLREVYGVDALAIAAGFQAMSDASRSGQSKATVTMMEQFAAVQDFAANQGKDLNEVMDAWMEANSDQSKAAGHAVDDVFRGGIANVSRHTKLPPALLEDLAYKRGEEVEFFAEGDFAGTPYRTLPARKKPLIQLGSDYYAVDPCFGRDAGYRALLHNLLQRKPGYRKSFEDRQKTMSEAAFADILAEQLPGANIFQEVYYKDPSTNQWAENDTLILIDDVLFLVEAKAGAAATIASPALDFARHAQSVQDLVIKAYKQCERFFNYLNSADEVTLYNRINSKYQECCRVRRSEYRVLVPIGLTVESFSPFSAYCKTLPQIEPLLGKHAFVSLSIDDLFVLKRFLPTAGSFAHYMEVRQAVAAIRQARLFDELDHLGAYLKKNRFDQDIKDQLKNHNGVMVLWDGMSDIVDRSFEDADWKDRPFPTQPFPEEVLKLLKALDITRIKGWLAAESHVRDLGEEGRNNLAKVLSDLRKTLNKHRHRYFLLSGDKQPLFVWLQRRGYPIDWQHVNDKASAAALAVNGDAVTCVLAEISADGTYHRAQAFANKIPKEQTPENIHIYEDSAKMAEPTRSVDLRQQKEVRPLKALALPGRNDPCFCGSGAKFKKCHGR